MIRGIEHLSSDKRQKIIWIAQPGEEKFLEKPYSSLPIPKGGNKEAGGGLFTWVNVTKQGE